MGPVNSETFSGISALKKVVIRADFLDAALPSGFFTSHTDLREIDLRSSGLTSIAADTFTGLDLLTDLDLSENSLTTLPDGLFTSLTSLSTLTLGTNNWDCTCDLAWLPMWSLYTGTCVTSLPDIETLTDPIYVYVILVITIHVHPKILMKVSYIRVLTRRS